MTLPPPRAWRVVVAALLLAGCTTAAMTRGLGTDEIPDELRGRPTTTASIGDLELDVAVADTPGSRRVGLMDVNDLGAVEGMVFVFDEPTETGFYMKNVRFPLDIAFVDGGGSVLAVLTMALCEADPCPTYRSPAPFRWALEAPAGTLAGIEPGDRFELRPWVVG